MNSEAYEFEELLVTLRRYGVTFYSRGDLRLELDPRWSFPEKSEKPTPDVEAAKILGPDVKLEQQVNPATGLTKDEESELFYSSGG